MSSLRAWCLRFTGLLGKERKDRELAEELKSHLQMHVEDNVRAGMSPSEARRNALIKLGGLQQTKELYRERRGLPFIESFLQDVRFGLRVLRKSPSFAIVAVLTLALGIGANSAIFSLVRTVLLQPLPYSDPDRIVQLETLYDDGTSPNISIPKITFCRTLTQVFQSVAAYDSGTRRANLTGGDQPEQVASLRVSAEFFTLLGVPVALGRTFTAAEDRPGGPHVVVISDGLWRNRYAGDRNLIGKTIDVGGTPYQILGVLGSGFRWEAPLDILLPLQMNPNSTSHSHDLFAAARLKPGVSLDQANSVLKVASEEFRRKFAPEVSFIARGLTTEPIRDVLVRDVRPALEALTGAVGLVLLIACANVASLLLARTLARSREIAVRCALGAGRRRIMFQILTESAVLSLGGGVLGLLLGHFGLHALMAINPGKIPRIGERGAGVTMDWRLLVFALLVTGLTILLFGLIPAVHASRVNLNNALRDSDSRSGARPPQNRVRSFLVVIEVALAIILLVGSALLMRTYLALRAVKPGFDARNVLTMDMSLDAPRFQKTAEVARLVRDGAERIKSLPGVQTAATTCSVPLERSYALYFTIEGRPLGKNSYHGLAAWRSVSFQYFDVFRIPTIQGRSFTDADNAEGAPVAVINETMARRFWPKDSPVGQRITLGKGLGPEFEEPPRLIVGVIGDVPDGGLDSKPNSMIYVPVSQLTDGLTALGARIRPLTWVIRTTVPPTSVSESVQRELRDASGGLPVGHIRPMDDLVRESTAQSDFNSALFAILASVALLLAAIGIYALMAHSVQQRTVETGIRRALGAPAGTVLTTLMRRGMALTLIGTLVGVVAALGLTRFLSSLLFGVRPSDPIAFISVIILLIGVALLGCYIPARRASKVDPTVALRYE